MKTKEKASPILLEYLQKRKDDASKSLNLKGDHLTPASAGVRQSLLGEWGDNNYRTERLNALVKAIYDWSSNY